MGVSVGAARVRHGPTEKTETPAVRFALDEWMLRLYRIGYDDPSYGDRATQVRELIWGTGQQVPTDDEGLAIVRHEVR